MEGSPAQESSAMDTTCRVRYLLNQDQQKLTELEKMILNCAADAKLSKSQWDEVVAAVGVEKIGDILELMSDDYDRCHFKPLLQRRVKNFHSFLYQKHWCEVEVAYCSGNAVAPLPPGKEDEEDDKHCLQARETKETLKEAVREDCLWRRCFICGRHTLSPITLKDHPDCPHIACSLECMLKLVHSWLDIKNELMSMERELNVDMQKGLRVD